MAKTKTSTEVKARWNAKTYNTYQLHLRKDDPEDNKIIEHVEKEKQKGKQTTEIFREIIKL